MPSKAEKKRIAALTKPHPNDKDSDKKPAHVETTQKKHRQPRKDAFGRFKLSPFQELHAETQMLRIAVLSIQHDGIDTKVRVALQTAIDHHIEKQDLYDKAHPQDDTLIGFQQELKVLEKQISDRKAELDAVKQVTDAIQVEGFDGKPNSGLQVIGVGNVGSLVDMGGASVGAPAVAMEEISIGTVVPLAMEPISVGAQSAVLQCGDASDSDDDDDE